MERWLWIPAVVCMAAGCQRNDETSLWEQHKSLSEEKTELTLQVERLQKENETLAEQVKLLSGLDKDVRLAGLVVPVEIKIGRYTGVYDKSGDGTTDGLAVYVIPLDASRDAVKASGSLHVELWDLAAESASARLAVWDVGAEELKKQWGRSISESYYRVLFPLEGIQTGDNKELTLRVQFVDYLSGKVLTAQKVMTR